MDWNWAQNSTYTVTQGWKPECGFLHYGWEGYSEALILYVLALGSPTYALPPGTYSAWNSTYQWETIYGRDVLYAGPLFIHQFSHAWLDLRKLSLSRQLHAVTVNSSDYFENTRSAAFIQREYAIRNPHGFQGLQRKRC